MNRESPSLENGTPGPTPPFEEECRQTLQGIRLALIEALAEIGVDASQPRQAARDLNIDKSLAWRISKIVVQPDVFQVVGNLPHRAGMGILCKAFEEAEVGPQTVQRLHDSYEAFEQQVVRHAGDRASFELVVRGLWGTASQGPSLEQDRKLAFRGNSAVWSAQARLQLSTAIIAPNADDTSQVDIARVFGLVDLRRFRPDVRWTLSRRHFFEDIAHDVRIDQGTPLDAHPASRGNSLIREFSSEEIPELILEDLGDELQCSLPEGRPGRTGELTALFGDLYVAQGSQYASDDDKYGQMIAKLLTPAEHLHFDLLVHEDLQWAMDPRIAVHGTLDGRPYRIGSNRPGHELPVTEPVIALGRGLAGTATPRMPWYGSLLEWTFERTGWDPSRFRAFRFEMAYPPVPAEAILYSELPHRKEGGTP